MEEGIHIDDYISDMLMSREWGGHTEIVAFSEIYNTSVHEFDSLALEESVIKIVTPNPSNEIAILFSGYHYDCLLKKRVVMKSKRILLKKNVRSGMIKPKLMLEV